MEGFSYIRILRYKGNSAYVAISGIINTIHRGIRRMSVSNLNASNLTDYLS